ncbi:uncharacterized protein B0I36DRAFT_84049 [Microdochium trichocladiopsis]|uniref:Uncharacterized protein n=1 Tax=Microdochium trichocladiopsis TaxID=1682393 RepID=A0A9P8YAN1_9PEZI|nr:uncharacterized protein B0I36DRAFT_84049 [Microdochium trichocladiopsis]KAH7034777.1 hypothetical protein B0I36DRAFT_84049 [Microdochium trichocladiopsis]
MPTTLDTTKPIVPVPAPWRLRGDVYVVTFFNKAGNLPEHTYSPLERDSSYADPALTGAHLGGLSQFQIIRYTDSPVGPYDELIVCPGYYNYQVDDPTRPGKRLTKKNVRISRIYVSQKYTCWNGRTNWNIPKHLARFTFTTNPTDNSTTVEVFPHDTTDDTANPSVQSLGSESQPATVPFFRATFHPQRFVPSFPLSLSWISALGMDIGLVQPPLPGNQDASQGELPGTQRWCKIGPNQSTRNASIGWLDMKQTADDGGEGEGAAKKGAVTTTAGQIPGCENFWPGMGRWQLAIKMDDAEIDFGHATYWETPKTMM